MLNCDLNKKGFYCLYKTHTLWICSSFHCEICFRDTQAIKTSAVIMSTFSLKSTLKSFQPGELEFITYVLGEGVQKTTGPYLTNIKKKRIDNCLHLHVIKWYKHYLLSICIHFK